MSRKSIEELKRITFARIKQNVLIQNIPEGQRRKKCTFINIISPKTEKKAKNMEDKILENNTFFENILVFLILSSCIKLGLMDFLCNNLILSELITRSYIFSTAIS